MSTSVQQPPETKRKAFLREFVVLALLALVVFFAYIFIRAARDRNLADERQTKWLSAYLAAVRQVRDDFATNAAPAVIERHIAEAQEFGRSEDPNFAERDENDRQRMLRSILSNLHQAVQFYAESVQTPEPDNKVLIQQNGAQVDVDKKVVLRHNGSGMLKQADAGRRNAPTRRHS